MKPRSAETGIYDGVISPDAGDFTRDIDLEKLNFVPWPGRFLVKRFAPDTKTKGGLHIPESDQRKKNWGHIVALPDDKAPPGAQIGDIVLFIEGAGELIEPLGKDYLLLDYRDDFDNDMLGIFKPKA